MSQPKPKYRYEVRTEKASIGYRPIAEKFGSAKAVVTRIADLGHPDYDQFGELCITIRRIKVEE